MGDLTHLVLGLHILLYFKVLQATEFLDIPGDNLGCTISTVVIPSPSIANLEPYISSLNSMACIGLAVVCPFGSFDTHGSDEGFSRH